MMGLPETWEWSTFGELCENHDGRRIPVKASERQNMAGEYPYYGASGIIDYVDDYLFDGTYLLVSEDGANLLARAKPIAFEATGRFWVNNHAHVVTARPGIVQRYLLHALERLDLSPFISGSAQPKITQANLSKVPIPVPPFPEQRRIVAAIEESFSRLDAAERNLGLASKRSRQLRAAYGDVLVSSGDFEHVPLGELLTDRLVGIVRPRSSQSVEEGIPYVRMQDIDGESGVISQPLARVAVSPEEHRRFSLQEGDLLFNTRNSAELVGKTAIVGTELHGAVFNNNLMRIRLKPCLLPQFALLQFVAPSFRQQLRSVTNATTSVAAIYAKNLLPLELAVPPIENQRSAVRSFEQLTDLTRRTERALSRGRSRSSTVRRSVLAAAFSGRLVPQDPSDEPASVLLERIAAERTAGKPPRRKQAAS